MGVAGDVGNEPPVGELSESVKVYLENLLQTYTGKLLARMSELEKLLLDKDKQINELGGSLAVVKSVNQNLTHNIEHLRTQLDDLEQYGRRTSVRIENIPYEKGESESSLKSKLLTCFLRLVLM